MLLVCNKHVKEGLKHFEVPHVKKVENHHFPCSFCKKEAEIKIYRPFPPKKRRVKVMPSI